MSAVKKPRGSITFGFETPVLGFMAVELIQFDVFPLS